MLQNPNYKRFTSSLVAKKIIRANSHTYRNAYSRLFWIRRLTEFFFTGLLIYAGSEFFFINQFAPIWAFSGVALSALYMRGHVSLIPIFISFYISFYCAGFGSFVSGWQSFLFTLIMFSIRYTGMGLIGAVIPLASLSVYVKWLLIVLFFVAAHIMIMFPHASALDRYTAFLGEMNGILCLTPLCLIFTPFTPQYYFNLRRWPWIAGSLVILTLHFGFFILPTMWLSFYAVLMLLLLVAYARFGVFPLCITILCLSVFYIASSEGRSLFQAIPQKQTVVLESLFCLSIILSLGLSIYFSLPDRSKT